VIAGDLQLVDESGHELVSITDFVLRRVDPGLVTSALTAPAAQARPRDAGRPGIRPAEGAEAFRRVLAADLGPQVVISAVPLAEVVERERRVTAETMAAGADLPPAPAASRAAGAAPRTELEAALARIWGEVLGADHVGASDDFFELGGNSLVAVQLIAQIRKATGVRLPMRTLFEASTVAGMAARVEQLRAAGEDSTVTIPKLPRGGR
jgi:acyl carrier protein